MTKLTIKPISYLTSGLCMCNWNPITIQAMLNHFATGNRSEYNALVQRQKELDESDQNSKTILTAGTHSVSVVSGRDLLDFGLPVSTTPKLEG